jgi:[ribosomal protein S5]-alanine N-acetyltransferase
MSLEEFFLRTDRLAFRSWSTADLPLAFCLWGDPVVTRFFGGPFSQEAVQQRLELEISSENAHHVQYWPIFLQSTGEFVGCTGLRPYLPSEQIFELGFHLRPHYWGKGFATEAAAGVVSYAFFTLRADGIFAAHHPANVASQHVIEKLGFRFTHTEHYAPTNEMHLAYLLTRST